MTDSVSAAATGCVLIGSTSNVDDHDTGVGHPERPARLTAACNGIQHARLGDATVLLPGRPASRDDLLRVHSAEYIDAICDFAGNGGGSLDPDTRLSSGSWTTALWAAGAGLAAVELLDAGAATAAFVAVRPPGHHATRNQAMGFCLLNNVAVTAAALADRGERVVIVDWDVHHGNGTQDIFWNDSRVLYVSTHQWPGYPGTGRASETGGPDAPGLTLNVPLPAGATGDVFLAAMQELVTPAVDRFEPTWVLISAGFDAHRDDPLADLALSAGDFADLTRLVMDYAPSPGRVVAILEGGYELRALARSCGATVAALAGVDYRPEPATFGGSGLDAVRELAARRSTT